MTPGLHQQRVTAAIERHLDAVFPGQRREDFVWTKGPIRESLPNLVMTRVAPREPSGAWHYVTRGLWEVASQPSALELLLMCPEPDAIHVETLAIVANYHADARYRIQLGQILDLGRPWIDGATCDHFLVSLPYPLGPQFEHLTVVDPHIRFLWLLPITRSEATFARAHGVEALEDAFERARFDTVDPARASVL